MKRAVILIIFLLMLGTAVLPTTAQDGPRAEPTLVNAAFNDYAIAAEKFHVDARLRVVNVQIAGIEPEEPEHTCAAGATAHSVWFQTNLNAGTLTLSTEGSLLDTDAGMSDDTVISLYRVTYYVFSSFDELVPMACDDGGTGPGTIVTQIQSPGLYVVQISTAPAAGAIDGASEYLLTASIDGSPVPHDEPSGAKKLNLVSLPSVVNIHAATRSFDEPVDPYTPGGARVTNSVWYKFNIKAPRLVSFMDHIGIGSWFSLFQKSGGELVIAPGYASGDIVSTGSETSALLGPGTYYLRVGFTSSPAGTSIPYMSFTVSSGLAPHNYQFAVPGTEQHEGATPSLEGWQVKHAAPGPDGDGVICEQDEPYYCYFRFVSDGPGEKTALKTSIDFRGTKVKKGDMVYLAVSLYDVAGTPNFNFTTTLVSKTGEKKKFALKVRDGHLEAQMRTFAMPKAMAVSKVNITVKNKDKTAGNHVGINEIGGMIVRLGDGSRGAAADGVLPAPPPPAN